MTFHGNFGLIIAGWGKRMVPTLLTVAVGRRFSGNRRLTLKAEIYKKKRKGKEKKKEGKKHPKIYFWWYFLQLIKT